ncbi:MAG TPA: calcium-binding protein, partial [Methyloceanibacter sp.]|nr:calcium-binding protein [Methyloceanibacter sp.]
IDTVVYGVSSAGVTVTLGKNGRETVGKGGEAQGDAIKSVENIQGSFVHNDKLTGNNLGNVFFGMGGNDTLSGGGGNDDLFGGNGNDKLIGGKANDFLEGGAGNDSFVFGPGFGQDNVTDFVAGAGTDDVLRFDKDVFKNFAAVLASSTQDGADVVITKGGNLVQLLNVQLADLHADDFAFF